MQKFKITNFFNHIILIIFFSSALSAKKVDYFELYGDIFQFLPAMAAAYTLIKSDYEGLGYLAISTATTLGATFAMKYSFVGISKKNKRLAKISRRPNGKDFDGFPSGHTSSAFSAAGFIQKRYGSMLGIPTTILASLVGISRITAKKHTTFQVLAGASLGYLVSYFVTQDDFNISINYEPSSGVSANDYYGLLLTYRF